MPEIGIRINFRDRKPVTEQIYIALLHQMSSGRIAPGEQLPTVRELADQLHVNFNTVARAYRLLDQEGLISTRQGRGTFVIQPEPVSEAIVEQPTDLKIKLLVSRFLEEIQRAGLFAADTIQAVQIELDRLQEKMVLAENARREKKKPRLQKHLRKRTSSIQAKLHSPAPLPRKRTAKSPLILDRRLAGKKTKRSKLLTLHGDKVIR